MAGGLLLTGVDVAIPDTPHLRLLALAETILIDIRSLCFPTFSKDVLCNLPALFDRPFGVMDVEGVHDFVGCDKAEVLQDAVAGQVVDELPQSREVPHESPGFLIWNNQIRGIQREVSVWLEREISLEARPEKADRRNPHQERQSLKRRTSYEAKALVLA